MENIKYALFYSFMFSGKTMEGRANSLRKSQTTRIQRINTEIAHCKTIEIYSEMRKTDHIHRNSMNWNPTHIEGTRFCIVILFVLQI